MILRLLIVCLSFFVQMSLEAIVYLEKPENFNPKVEVVGCFLCYQDKILLLHRQENKSQGNLWGIPGGKIEKKESPIQAAIRETFEETGFDLSDQKLVYLGKVYIKYPNSDFIYHMLMSTPKEKPEMVKINFQEHKGFTWLTPSDALKMDLMLDEDTCIKLVYEEDFGLTEEKEKVFNR